MKRLFALLVVASVTVVTVYAQTTNCKPTEITVYTPQDYVQDTVNIYDDNGNVVRVDGYTGAVTKADVVCQYGSQYTGPCQYCIRVVIFKDTNDNPSNPNWVLMSPQQLPYGYAGDFSIDLTVGGGSWTFNRPNGNYAQWVKASAPLCGNNTVNPSVSVTGLRTPGRYRVSVQLGLPNANGDCDGSNVVNQYWTVTY